MKVFVLIMDDRFSESFKVFGVYSSRELAELGFKQIHVDEQYRTRIVEYELDAFRAEGHFSEFELEEDP